MTVLLTLTLLLAHPFKQVLGRLDVLPRPSKFEYRSFLLCQSTLGFNYLVLQAPQLIQKCITIHAMAFALVETRKRRLQP